MVSDVGAFELPGEDGAGLHRLAVHMHHAGAALRGVAADMRAGEPQVLAQELHQQGARIDITGDGFAVHRHCDGGHGVPPQNPGQTPCFWRRRPEPAADRVEIGSILPRFRALEQVNSEPRQARPVKGVRRVRVPSARRARRGQAPIHRGGELHEEVVGGLLGGAVDQALAELGELAADLRLDVIGQQRAAVLVGRATTVAPPLAKPATPPSPSPGDPVAVGRIEVGEPHLALPARLHRADLDGGDGLEFVVAISCRAARSPGCRP